MIFTKERMVDPISNHFDLPTNKTVALVESLFETMKRTLVSGEDLLITVFGKFYVKERSERKGRNAHTGDEIMLKARPVVTFRCSPVLKEKVNGKDS